MVRHVVFHSGYPVSLLIFITVPWVVLTMRFSLRQHSAFSITNFSSREVCGAGISASTFRRIQDTPVVSLSSAQVSPLQNGFLQKLSSHQTNILII
jgi:hypothetical protein